MELISIIVTVYNKSKYLAECLDSIRAQTYRNIEVILVDDGSTDQSADICKRYVSSDSRFVYCYQKNSGQNAARKLGVDKATGVWILSIDADDFVPSDMCEKLMIAQKKERADIVVGKIQKYKNGQYKQVLGSITGTYTGAEVISKCISSQFFSFLMPVAMYSTLYKKDYLKDFFHAVDLRINYSEDCACSLFSLTKAERVCLIPDVVYYYRQYDDSFCNVHNKTNVFSQKLLQEFLKKMFISTIDEKISDKLVRWLIVRDLLLGGYEFFSDYVGIFPYCEVLSGSRVAIYGAGMLGEELYEKLPSKYIRSGWFDKEAKYYQKNGKNVKLPQEIDENLFDYILIAVTNPDISEQIANELKSKMKNPEKVLIISERIIDSEYTIRKLNNLEHVNEKYVYVSA